MAYTAYTATTFKTRFPAFADGADSVIEGALTRARRVVTDKWLADDRAEGEALYAAHEMTLDGLGTNREAQLAGFKRLKLGSLELERDTATSGQGYKSTTYGQRFIQIMRRNNPGVMVVNS